MAASRSKREQRGDAAVVVARTGGPGVVARAEGDLVRGADADERPATLLPAAGS
jgi:hypothetical protein